MPRATLPAPRIFAQGATTVRRGINTKKCRRGPNAKEDGEAQEGRQRERSRQGGFRVVEWREKSRKRTSRRDASAD
jgi:hypothetical protein